MTLKIVLIIVGIITLLIPIIKLIIGCKTASDITYTLGQPGNMKLGVRLYLLLCALGGVLIACGILI